jgi:HAAS domain-containing protein
MGLLRERRSGGDLDMIERWLTEFQRHLRVHGRRRRRIVEELAGHLHEASAIHGESQAIARIGDAEEVARSFTPRLGDRAFEQRDRLAALTMLAAMAASLPLALDLEGLGRQADSWAWLWFLVFLAPTAGVAFVSSLAVLRGRSLGSRLAPALAAMVAITAVVVVLGLPPAGGEFSQYQAAVRAGHEAGGCSGPLAACARDHAFEIRFNYSAGAVLLSLVYLWAVTGWTPRRQRSQGALA